MRRIKTTVAKPAEVNRSWYVIDATDVPMGRLATRVANLLTGKGKVDYTPHVDSGDHVIIINASNVKVTGKKLQQKTYYRHSGYPGNLKEEKLEQRMLTNPAKAIEAAVYGMINKNKLRPERMQRLKVYAGSDHKHDAQKPQKVEVK